MVRSPASAQLHHRPSLNFKLLQSTRSQICTSQRTMYVPHVASFPEKSFRRSRTTDDHGPATEGKRAGGSHRSSHSHVPSRLHRHRHSVQETVSGFGNSADMYLTKRHKHRHSKTHHHIKDALQTTIPAPYQDAAATRARGGHRVTGSEDRRSSNAVNDSERGNEEVLPVRRPRAVRPQDVEKEKWKQKLRDE